MQAAGISSLDFVAAGQPSGPPLPRVVDVGVSFPPPSDEPGFRPWAPHPLRINVAMDRRPPTAGGPLFSATERAPARV